MKARNILLGILSLMTFATYAQTGNNKKVETKTSVTELKVETENFEELKNFDWNMVKEMFEENDSEQVINLAFAYTNISESDKSKFGFDNFEMKLTGKTSDLDKMTSKLKKAFKNIDAANAVNNKN